MATANLTNSGDVLMQNIFRAAASKIRIKGTRSNGTIDFTKISDDPVNWGTPTARVNNSGGLDLSDTVSFYIELLPTGGTYQTEELQFLDSSNRKLLTVALPVDGTSNPTYSWYVNGATSGTVRDGSSGKYTLSTLKIWFSE